MTNLLKEESLNEKGKNNLMILIWLTLVALAFSAFGLIWTFKFQAPSYFLFITIAFPLVFFSYLNNQLHKSLEAQSLLSMGFTVSVVDTNILDKYTLKYKGDLKVSSVYSGAVHGAPVKLVHFSIAQNPQNQNKKNKQVIKYIGLEFETVKENYQIQLYDNEFFFKPNDLQLRKLQRKLESDEFHKIFSVYSHDAKNPFYQLAPDAMHDLMVKRKELGIPINMETLWRNVFIFTNTSKYNKLFEGRLSFKEILNGRASGLDLHHYQQSIVDFVEELKSIFSILNAKSVKVGQTTHKTASV